MTYRIFLSNGNVYDWKYVDEDADENEISVVEDSFWEKPHHLAEVKNFISDETVYTVYINPAHVVCVEEYPQK